MIKTTDEIRRAFLAFFESKGHRVMPSGPVVPAADPSLMFANAGMVQFKNVFIGKQKRPAPCVTTVQKCIRISGKHNDLENVGRTSRHHTFFEMLGNFSFGDYFKEDACRFGWAFLTEVLGFDTDRLWVSVFKGDQNAPADQEAVSIWVDRIGVSPDRILKGDAADNFWSMGDVGPCGPCSEIMYDRGAAFGEACLENGERFFEVWNLVFMQYMVETVGGEMRPLPAPCIDTGAGLERIASVLQGVDSNYDIDVFVPLRKVAEQVSGKLYGDDPEDDVSMRVIADHARMAAHLIAEGVFPEKTGREYVLRRVMRRAIRHGHRLGIGEVFFHKLAAAVVTQMGSAYPELVERAGLIENICKQEEERFRDTLSKGLDLLESNTEWRYDDAGDRLLPGNIAFDLSATYGFPVDLVEVIGTEEGFGIDYDELAQAQTRHKEASGRGKIGEAAVSQVYRQIVDSIGETDFVGYDSLFCQTLVMALLVDGDRVDRVCEGEAEVVLAATPFYGESGGQVGDAGILTRDGVKMRVLDTVKPVDGLFVHRCRMEVGSLSVGDTVTATVENSRRRAVAAHHTATHLLHYAIRQVVGDHATQKGSKVSADGLRFDFSHFHPLAAAQVGRLEEIVTQMVIDNQPVETTVTSYEQARHSGAMALFEENYGEAVRLVDIGGKSRELCGGTHVSRTGTIGPFMIVSEAGVAAGVRRIEAVCGMTAFNALSRQRNAAITAGALLKSSPESLVERVEKVMANERELKKEIEQLKRDMAKGGTDVWERRKNIHGVQVLAAKLPIGEPGTLRDTADAFRQKMGSGVVCLGGENNGRVSLVIGVTKDLTEVFHAGKLIKHVASQVGGKGGGRADFAQAGGVDVSRLEDAIDSVYQLVEDVQNGDSVNQGGDL